MCDHCGCRDLTPVARLMAEHDRLRELSGLISRALTAGQPARCVEEVFPPIGMAYQCLRKRGQGRHGAYCKQHAKRFPAIESVPPSAEGARAR